MVSALVSYEMVYLFKMHCTKAFSLRRRCPEGTDEV